MNQSTLLDMIMEDEYDILNTTKDFHFNILGFGEFTRIKKRIFYISNFKTLVEYFVKKNMLQTFFYNIDNGGKVQSILSSNQ